MLNLVKFRGSYGLNLQTETEALLVLNRFYSSICADFPQLVVFHPFIVFLFLPQLRLRSFG